MAYWLLKTEAGSYGWSVLVRDGGTEWDGIRNAAAAKNLRTMHVGDEALFYHSGPEKAAVGIVRITRAARPDGEGGPWVSVGIEPIRALQRPVGLAEMKAAPTLAGMAMLRQSRLSVSAVGVPEWAAILALAAR